MKLAWFCYPMFYDAESDEVVVLFNEPTAEECMKYGRVEQVVWAHIVEN